MSRWAPDAALRLETAAMELFAEHGYAGTTVPEIAARAGLSTRTFFRHFTDKREVLFLRDREFAEVVARVLADAPSDASPWALAMHGIETIAGTDLERWRTPIAARQRVIAAEPQLRERERGKSAALADAVREALLARGADPHDAALIAQMAVTILDTATATWLAGPPDVSLTSIVRSLQTRLRVLVAEG